MTRGLTLLELVVTIALAGLIGIPLGMLLAGHMQASVESQDSTRAMNLARAEMEMLDTLENFVDSRLALGSSDVSASYPDAAGFVVQRTVGCETAAGTCDSMSGQGIKRITVTVSRAVTQAGTGPVRRELVTLITYRTKSVQFGL